MYTFLTRILVFLCLAALLAGAFVWYTPHIKKNEELQRALMDAEQELEAANDDYRDMSLELVQIQTHPRKIEKHIRESFRYARPNETVFIFETRRPSVTVPLKNRDL